MTGQEKMTTINLHQDKKREEMNNKASKMNTSLVFSLVVAVLFVASWVGLVYGKYYFEKKDAQLKIQIENESEELNGKKNIDDVIDLQERLKQIKSNLDSKIETNDVLNKVAANTISGVVFTSYSNVGKKVSVSLRATNFNDISKQLFNFKQADFVTSVSVAGVTRVKDGIDCDIEIVIK